MPDIIVFEDLNDKLGEVKAFNSVITSTVLSPAAVRIYLNFLRYARKASLSEDGAIFPKVETICRDCNISKATYQRQIKTFVRSSANPNPDVPLVSSKRRFNQSNIYTIHKITDEIVHKLKPTVLEEDPFSYNLSQIETSLINQGFSRSQIDTILKTLGLSQNETSGLNQGKSQNETSSVKSGLSQNSASIIELNTELNTERIVKTESSTEDKRITFDDVAHLKLDSSFLPEGFAPKFTEAVKSIKDNFETIRYYYNIAKMAHKDVEKAFQKYDPEFTLAFDDELAAQAFRSSVGQLSLGAITESLEAHFRGNLRRRLIKKENEQQMMKEKGKKAKSFIYVDWVNKD